VGNVLVFLQRLKQLAMVLGLFTALGIARGFNQGKHIALYPTVETVGYGFGFVCVFSYKQQFQPGETYCFVSNG
jgi:hypothetical protein